LSVRLARALTELGLLVQVVGRVFSDEWQENLAGMCNHKVVIHFAARAIFKNLSR